MRRRLAPSVEWTTAGRQLVALLHLQQGSGSDGVMTEIERELRSFLAENYVYADEELSLQGDDSFMEMGLIDSTGVLELVAFLEQRFDMVVGDDELVPENLDSINNLLAFLARRNVGGVSSGS